MSPAENTPNFDSMSPEEIMAWMESLAKRQGASEGFTTAADMEIAEIDPTSVQIDEPGYIPYGKDPQKWAEEEAARKAAAPAQPRPAPAAPPAAPAWSAPPPTSPEQPAAQVPPPAPSAPPAPPAAQSAMSWLESLAADQGELPELDLSGLAADITPVEPAPASAVPASPIDWLESLAQGPEEVTQTSEAVSPEMAADPFAENVDPMSWLESVARRQGAKGEELLTDADLEVPAPGEAAHVEGPGYTPYSFDALGLTSKAEESLPAEAAPEPQAELEPDQLEDPAAWLDSLASSQGFHPEAIRGGRPERQMSDDEIQAALARGEQIPQDQMARWMSRQLEIGATRDEPEAEYDPDAPAVPAELPDWLIEQVGPAAPEDAAPPGQPPLIDIITEPPPVADIPDWLREEAPAGSDLDNIFAAAEPEVPETPPTPAAELELDAEDSWAEALEYERQHDISSVPDWYIQNINDPARRAAVEGRLAGEPEQQPELSEAEFEPEEELPAGEPEAIPSWLHDAISDQTPPEVVQAIADADDMPDWLRDDVEESAEQIVAGVVEPEADIPDWLKAADPDEVPDWLRESIVPAAEEAPPASPPPVVIEPARPVEPVVSPAPAPASPPAPVPQAAESIDPVVILNDARASASSQDIDASLRQYEALVRANAELEIVSADLELLAEHHKSSPALYRVLGDSLMRQGKLQAALDTYRKALNQL